ncbi:hypothetical protein F7Q99_36300 [Streptomyces kaniharaensis]|uniref:Uncharacterized protein n=1 Tax=Streptomyces kaniharaensis TaxID=212423 RepID=A0A6N7L2S6_9ACTN|nr:hypothetical protein [Streptomyces kaniharaensis]MQS17505.1 hypothetical protein [Streptomyces kaniharaensis]
MPSTALTITPGPVPDLTHYDIICGNLSGGADSRVMQYLLMEAARAVGVADRMWTFHATLGPVEWPGVTFGGRRYPSMSELAARQSRESGVLRSRHERTKTTNDGVGGNEPQDLLTHIAAYGYSCAWAPRTAQRAGRSRSRKPRSRRRSSVCA